MPAKPNIPSVPYGQSKNFNGVFSLLPTEMGGRPCTSGWSEFLRALELGFTGRLFKEASCDLWKLDHGL